MTQQAGNERVWRFVRSLRIALWDVEREGGSEENICYYHDADVTMRMILGFMILETTFREATPSEDLVRALLSYGYLGRLHVLPPHAWEIDEKIRMQPDFRSELTANIFAQRAQEHIRKTETEKHLDSLLDIVKMPEAPEREKRFVHYLASVAPDAFVVLESVRGTWKQRLHHYWKTGLLRFDATGWDLPELLNTSVGRTMVKAVATARANAALLVNNLRDAAALATLAQHVANPRQTKLVRFYTETSAIWRALREEGVREALSYPETGSPKGMFDDDCRLILRRADYYILRARFEALRFPGVKLRGDALAEISLDDLRGYASQLEDMLTAGRHEAIERVELGGKRLSAILDELESRVFISTIWRRYEFPQMLSDYLSEWGSVWTFARGEGTLKLLQQEIKEIEDQLRTRVSAVRKWFEDVQQIRDSVTTLRNQWKTGEIPDPMRDLGLVRWGVDLDEEHRAALADDIRNLIAEDEPTREQACLKLAASLHEEPDDSQRAVITCAILWLLNQQSMIVAAVRKFLPHVDQSARVTLQLLSTAAELRGSLLLKHSVVKERLSELRKAVRRIKKDRARYLLGLGYVEYYAWHNATTGKDTADPRDVTQWAKDCFETGREAAAALPKNSLLWAFAVNHCTYVGYEAGVERRSADDFRDQLLELMSIPSVWHYRFADTIASTYMRTARERLRSYERGTAAPELLQFVLRQLAKAEQFLNEAEPSFGDPEIKLHRKKLEDLKDKAESLKLDSIGVPEATT